MKTDRNNMTNRYAKTMIMDRHNNYSSANRKITSKLQRRKEKWIQKYAERILKLWSQWQTPLGVSVKYVEHIKQDLTEYYEVPLKKRFIESTYRP